MLHEKLFKTRNKHRNKHILKNTLMFTEDKCGVFNDMEGKKETL